MRKLLGVQVVFSLSTTLLLSPFANSESGISHEETYVRAAYAKLDYATQLSTVTDTALNALATGDLNDTSNFHEKLLNAEVTFDLDDFKVGNISDIANIPWGTLTTPLTKDSMQLDAQIKGRTFKDNDLPGQTWKVGVAKWKPFPNGYISSYYAKAMGMTFHEMIEKGGQYFTPYSDAVFTRYAAFEVTVHFQGKTVGPYKALFLFGKNAEGLEVVSPQDHVVSASALFAVSNTPLYPTGLLRTRLRETAAAANWLSSSAVSESACSISKSELCCTHASSGSKCGVSDYDLQDEMSAPLPPMHPQSSTLEPRQN